MAKVDLLKIRYLAISYPFGLEGLVYNRPSFSAQCIFKEIVLAI
jgi:hypothetical protein